MHVLNINLLSKVTVQFFRKLTVVQTFSNLTCGWQNHGLLMYKNLNVGVQTRELHEAMICCSVSWKSQYGSLASDYTWNRHSTFAFSVLAINASLLQIIIQQATPRSNRMHGPHTVQENKAVLSNLTNALEYKPKRYIDQYSKLATMWKLWNCSSIPGEVRNFSLKHTPAVPTEQSDRVLQAAIYKEIKQSTIWLSLGWESVVWSCVQPGTWIPPVRRNILRPSSGKIYI